MKVPDEALIADLKQQLSVAIQKLSANEQYILEMEEQITKILKSTREDRFLMKTERRVLLLTNANIKFRKEIKELRMLNNRYLVKMLDNEKNNNANNT